MPSIDPAPRSGAAPAMPARSAAPPMRTPRPHALLVPENAARTHLPDAGDYITLGVGLAGIGALGFAATGAAEGLTVGAAALAKAAGAAAKAYGPRLAEHWREGTAQLKDGPRFGKFAADQTTAALADFARAAVVGAGVSAAATLSRHAADAVRSAASQPARETPATAPRPEAGAQRTSTLPEAGAAPVPFDAANRCDRR